MAVKRPPTIGLVWSQFAPYHLDRCEAVGSVLDGEAQVLAIEVATASRTYAWEPSGELQRARKITLFPGQCYEDIPVLRRLGALLSATRRCDIVFFGIGYNELHIIALSLMLRLLGKRIIMMTDSKFDDQRRSIPLELAKSTLLRVFHGALVAGHRQAAYVRFLGFRRRPVTLGYDCINNDRIRQQAISIGQPQPVWAERPFICVGRLVPKKNPFVLLEAFALYVASQGTAARHLVMVGSGPLEDELRAHAQRLGIADKMDMVGFLQAPAVAAAMTGSLALLLVSTEEQWGLVINEAVALGLPVIVSEAVGARDLLVDNLLNGYVISADNVEAIARAMICIGEDEERWNEMCSRSLQLAAKGDVSLFAASVKEMTST
jgi:glycosyltransferase involved in cell wall biosynthesis